MSEEAGNDTLVAEIGEAIKSMEEPKATEPQVEPGVETQGAETAEAPTAETSKEPEAFVADDDLIKRGVLAGLDVADVKAFASKEQAEKIIGALEAKTATPKTEAKTAAKDGDDGFPVADFDKAVKEMEDAKDDDGNAEYDPKFVNLFKTMSGLLKSQANEIAALKKAGATAEAQTAFDRQFGGLDEAIRSKVDAASKQKLREKFDFLVRAHKFAKDKATDADIFEEAKRIALGDLAVDDAATRKAEAIASRQTLKLARPGGESGQRGADRPASDEEIADALFRELTK